MGEEYLLLGDIPLDFQKVLMRAFVPYSVGLARVSQDDPKLFTALGSGTLVRKGTAHRCSKRAALFNGVFAQNSRWAER